MQTKMLPWTAGVTRMDRIRYDAIRQKRTRCAKLACDGMATFCVGKKTSSASYVLSWKRQESGLEDARSSVGRIRSGKVASRHQKSGRCDEMGQTLKKKKKIIIMLCKSKLIGR
ncbi:unnamed protein product [Heligmosomoides polygyrus]|uniref:Uncharacterized protein n=1 Tax=Heligmosomoides polygyrus TaxID=6339 RepID=A0A183GPR1_HELPZ|nr:unnamed protein product [Heligmosomoides polygyrus]